MSKVIQFAIRNISHNEYPTMWSVTWERNGVKHAKEFCSLQVAKAFVRTLQTHRNQNIVLTSK